MIIYEGTNILVSGAFLKCFSILCLWENSVFNILSSVLRQRHIALIDPYHK